MKALCFACLHALHPTHYTRYIHMNCTHCTYCTVPRTVPLHCTTAPIALYPVLTGVHQTTGCVFCRIGCVFCKIGCVFCKIGCFFVKLVVFFLGEQVQSVWYNGAVVQFRGTLKGYNWYTEGVQLVH